MNNRIYCPVANGWAERISKSKKIHVCRQCKHSIDKGSSYVSLHVNLGGPSWVSEAMCDDCYAIAFEKAFDFTPPVKALPDGIEMVYRTADGEVFDELSKAEKHMADAAKYCLMYNDRGERTYEVDNAMVLKILNGAGMTYFVNACKKCMKENPSFGDVSGGLIKDYEECQKDLDLYERLKPVYLWNDDRYMLIDLDQHRALLGYIVDNYGVK
jgi:hypothetical protein